MYKQEFIREWHKLCSNNEGRAVIMMSGLGTNAIKLLESQIRFKGMKIIGIFSDSSDSNASKIGQIGYSGFY